MKRRRRNLIIHQSTNGRTSFSVGYWQYPTPTEKRDPVFRSFGSRDTQEEAVQLAEAVAKQNPEFRWRPV